MAYQFTASPLLARKTLHRCRDITYVNLNFAKVDVASSSLVTVALAKADRPDPYKLRLAGQPCDVLRLLAQVEIVSEKTICRLDARSTPAA